MVECNPPKKQGEQFPLLKVDTGGGDGGGLHPSTVVTTGWSVTCAPKKSWIVRWPEYVSACWMTFILLGIFFLVFYALTMEAYRRQPIVVIKCNDPKPASNVYFHQIVQQGSYIPFALYSGYLAALATTYPSLHFHIVFLVDDTQLIGLRDQRHSRLINRLIPYTPFITSRLLEENNMREIREFQRKYQNVNVTISSLSKFMGMTPLKYKWRTIPQSYLPFYARVFSVWQNGGVGMDLSTFNSKFSSRQLLDKRISEILKQHNDGARPEDYTNALNKIDRDEENEFFSMFYGLINQVINETRTFLSRISNKNNSPNEKLIRNHRNKRDLSQAVDKHDDINNNSVKIEPLIAVNDSYYKNHEYQTVNNLEITVNTVKNEILKTVAANESSANGSMLESLVNKSEIVLSKPNVSQVFFFYDFALIPDVIGSSHNMLPDVFKPPNFKAAPSNYDPYKHSKDINAVTPYLLSIDSEGIFVSALTPLHPFLGYLTSAGCQRMHPRIAIQKTVLTQCSGIYRDEISCNSVYFL